MGSIAAISQSDFMPRFTVLDCEKKEEGTYLELKKYKKENAAGFLNIEKNSYVKMGEMYEETHIAYVMPEIGDQIILYERVNHSRREDEYLPKDKPDFITGELPVWEVVSFSKGTSLSEIKLHNNFIQLKRKTRKGVTLRTTIKTLEIGLGTLKFEKVI